MCLSFVETVAVEGGFKVEGKHEVGSPADGFSPYLHSLPYQLYQQAALDCRYICFDVPTKPEGLPLH